VAVSESGSSSRVASRPERLETLRRGVRDLGGVLLSWAVLVALEFVVIGVTCRGLFAGNWELILGRKLVGPIALAMLVPAALVVVLEGRLITRAATRPRARMAVGLSGGVAAAAAGLGVTQGRHFASVALRVPFVALAFALGFAVAFAIPRVARSFDARRGRVFAVLGAAVTVVVWFIDGHVLVRLYPAFHASLLAMLLASWALTSLAWRSPSRSRVSGTELALGVIGLVLAAGALVWAPFAARRLARSDNLRLILVEHAPLLGPAVLVAARLSPPVMDVTPELAATPLTEIPRALDWAGQDILLVSVDALRADHLSAYGYARATTPNLDALAKKSAVFEHAYCPTPHTSYSVTSMMTGKAMRPLLALGLGETSDTWATDLRRYGYKTAAFYPPAVFYIDASRFTPFEQSGLGFEYRWVEFTTAEEKVAEVETYLKTAGPAPLFLWVHMFEPHEPYVTHPSYPFSGGEPAAVDAYDSEVAYADAAIGALLRVVRAARPNVTVIVTADHGEEFGEHGGRYHGTTCYEEQVRVPLLVSGPGVVPRRVATVVQTIDLLPTVLSAVGIPRPARVRGRDLGAVLADRKSAEGDPGVAYAETDDQTLLARGDDRLICARKIGACALYDVAKDPTERVDRAVKEPGVARELRALTLGIERDQGRYEAAEVVWPDALRRGLQGEVDAAEDVAGLLDDASVAIRRKAAEVTSELAAPVALPQTRRAFARDEDAEVRRWTALALVRMGDAPSPVAEALVHDGDKSWRRAAPRAFASRGDARGGSELTMWWREEAPPRPGLDAVHAKALVAAIARIRDTDAVPALVSSLDYVPLRPALAEALGTIGDLRARAPLLSLLGTERFETARPFEARAIVALGSGKDLLAPLTLFAGLPDPMTEAIEIARDGKLLDARRGGVSIDPKTSDVETRVVVPVGVPLRLWVLAGSGGGDLSGAMNGERIGAGSTTGIVHAVDLPARAGSLGDTERVTLSIHEPQGVVAAWVVPRVAAVPPLLVAREPDAGSPALHVPP
jgi:arylsulfatase A-like enzyme